MKNSIMYRFILLFLGTVSLILGILGVFLPLLPTTPFLLLTAAFYFRGSERFYNWLINHKILGGYIRNFRENRSVPLRVKIVSVSLLWITILSSAYFFVPYLWIQIVMIIVAILVTRHILSFNTSD